MKITELLTESEIQHLEEGPKLDAFGRAVGGAVGGVAKGVGAVAGGVKGAWDAAKQGFQAGRDAVSGKPAAPAAGVQPAQAQAAAAPSAGVPAAPAQPTAQAAPDPASTGGFQAPQQAAAAAPEPATTAADANAQGPKGTAPAKPQTGDAAAAMKKGAAATAGAGTEKAGQTLYAQVKAQVGQLDKKGKQRILQLLQKSIQQAPAKDASAMGNMAGQLGAETPPANTMANAPVSKTNKAKPGNPNAAPAADATQTAPAQTAPAAGATQTAPAQEPVTKPKRTRNKKTAATPAAAPTQAQLDADREAAMGPTSDSIIRTGNNLAETLLKAIAAEKSRMVAEGKISIFRAH